MTTWEVRPPTTASDSTVHLQCQGAKNGALPLMFAAAAVEGTKLGHAPRMIEFARLGVAAERALGWPEGSFLAALSACDHQLKDELLEADPVGRAVLDYMQNDADWQGTATDLLQVLNGAVPDSVRQSKAWPKNARTLSMRLQRAAPVLRHAGVSCERRHRAKQRVITLARTAPAPVPSASAEATEYPDPPREATS